jgi:hypothetical protein
VKKHFYLCTWDSLAKPKFTGGWGIKNLVLFNIALATKTLWRGLTTIGIWKKVIKEKYLPFDSVSLWFKMETNSNVASSPVWRHLLKSKKLLDHWLSWKTGNGSSIQVGRDHIMGLDNLSILSAPLLNALKSRGLTFIYQARNNSPLVPSLSY